MKRKRLILNTAYYVLVTVGMFLMLYPIFWMVGSSFKDNSEIFVDAYRLIPREFLFSNYVEGWRGFAGVGFGTFFRNSFVIATATTIGQVMSSALIAYGFARIKFKGRNILFAVMMVTLLVPAQVLIVPQYILFSNLGWINTFKPLIVPSFFGAPFFIFLIMQFIRGIPNELDEAARIDGCGRLGMFFKIMLPLIKPALITSGIFAFYWSWDNFMAPLLYLQRVRLFPVSVALQMFSDPSTVTNWGAMFAMSTLSFIPQFILFIIFQKYIVQGISTSGLKG